MGRREGREYKIGKERRKRIQDMKERGERIKDKEGENIGKKRRGRKEDWEVGGG